jgi:hypothetical protein
MMGFFSAEWQTSGEKLSFEGSQVSSGVLAEAERILSLLDFSSDLYDQLLR